MEKVPVPAGTSLVIMKKLTAYRNNNGGLWGVCKKCSQEEALKRYPK